MPSATALDASAITVHRQGNGPPLVLLHCLGVDHRFWDFAAPLAADVTLLRYDLPGHGASAVHVGALGCRSDQWPSRQALQSCRPFDGHQSALEVDVVERQPAHLPQCRDCRCCVDHLMRTGKARQRQVERPRIDIEMAGLEQR